MIRAVAAHGPLMAELHASAFPPSEAWGAAAFEMQLALPGTFGFVDPEGGMILCRVAADEAEVLTLAVHPVRRRRGIAWRLLRRAIEEALGRGAGRMFLEVSSANAGGRALYASAGFREAGLRRGYYRDGSDALVLRARAFSG